MEWSPLQLVKLLGPILSHRIISVFGDPLSRGPYWQRCGHPVKDPHAGYPL